MTAIASTRSRRKNRNRRARLATLREEVAQLRRERLLLARMALQQHPRGGFFNPLVAFETEALAERVLAEPAP